jgi:hypothetical protein
MTSSASTSLRETEVLPQCRYDPNWCRADLARAPQILVAPPGPQSRRMHTATSRIYKGLSRQVNLFPVCCRRGHGVTFEDVDGDRYLDFSSGIYVSGLGHCHPKVSQAFAYWANRNGQGDCRLRGGRAGS